MKARARAINIDGSIEELNAAELERRWRAETGLSESVRESPAGDKTTKPK